MLWYDKIIFLIILFNKKGGAYILQTVILRTMNYSLGGVVEYTVLGDSLKVSYNLNRKSEKQNPILKLVLMSSQRPFNTPVIADTIEFDRLDASGNKLIGIQELSLKGYNASDIDTFAVVSKENGSAVVAAVGFSGLLWDVSQSVKNMFASPRDFALVRGELLLKKIKRPVEDEEAFKRTVEELEALKSALNTSLTFPCPNYAWYDLTELRAPLEVSSYKHLLYVPEVYEAFIDEKILLFGIGEGGRSAFALRTTGANPFVNADDCAVKYGDYWVVGVCFAPDGQYFEKIQPKE